jgi:hypothetical protein
MPTEDKITDEDTKGQLSDNIEKILIRQGQVWDGVIEESGQWLGLARGAN